MNGCELFFDYVHLLYYTCYKVNRNRGGSQIHSPDWRKNEKAINPIYEKYNK